MSKKVLIMSASTGGGHNRAAKAMKDEIEKKYPINNRHKFWVMMTISYCFVIIFSSNSVAFMQYNNKTGSCHSFYIE